MGKLTLKQQIKTIHDAFRVGNFERKEFAIKELNSCVGSGEEEPFKRGVDFLRNKGIVSVKEINEGQVVALNDYAKLYSLLCNMKD